VIQRLEVRHDWQAVKFRSEVVDQPRAGLPVFSAMRRPIE
jgi:hypothetical protein